LGLSNILTLQKLQNRSCKVCVLPALGISKSPGLHLDVQTVMHKHSYYVTLISFIKG